MNLEKLIKDAKFFDCLVAYFYVSGFYVLFKSLEKTERIRILIGIGTSRETYNLIKTVQDRPQQLFQFSYTETRQKIENTIIEEMEDSEDSQHIEDYEGYPEDYLKRTVEQLPISESAIDFWRKFQPA